MENQELDQLRDAYKVAVDQWVAAIRAEVGLATPEHSVRAEDLWENAGFAEEEARTRAQKAKQAYEDALRQVNFHF